MLHGSAFRVAIPVILLSLFFSFGFPLPASAETARQVKPPGEPNDTFGSAAVIPPNAGVEGAIFPRGDVDWYLLAVDRPGELKIDITGSPATLDIDFRVWNANRDTITDWFAPMNQGGNAVGVVDLPEAGRYYVEVRDGGDDAEAEAPYTLATAFTPAADAGEPNNSFGTATPLALGMPLTADILPRADADWYAVDVDHHGALKIALSGGPPNLELVFRIWNANRDTMTDWFAPLAAGGAVEGVIDLPAPGRYYVEVHDGGDDARSVAPYTITADFAPSADLFEPNNSFGAATPIKIGTPISATILPARDADWFAFDAPHHGELKLAVTNVDAELAVFVRLWNGNRDTLTDWFRPLNKGGDTVATVDLPAPGRYYLELLADGDQRAIQPFGLRVDFTPAADAHEPNNSFGHATTLGVDRSVEATILPAGDADWFYFDVAAPGEVGFKITQVDPAMAVLVRAWNANRDTISDWFRPLNKGGDTQGSVDITTPGRYALEVIAESGQRSIQPYLLQIGYAQSADTHEPNDSYAGATPVGLDQVVVGAVWPAGDSDWYAVVVPQPGDLHILATQLAPDQLLSLRLWNATESPVSDWFVSPAAGQDVTAVISATEAMTYVLEVRAEGNVGAVEPYLLYFSMQPIDPAKVTLPGGGPAATTEVTTTTATPTTTKTETTEISPTGKVTILTSGQIGPLGGDLFVSHAEGLDGARLTVPPGALPTLTTIDIGVGPDAPAGAPFGLNPAGSYWAFSPTGLNFAQPVTITLPVPAGAAAPQMFIGHWDGSQWVDLGGIVENGFISAATDHFSTFGVFCGALADYGQVNFVNGSSSPYINLRYVSGPSPAPGNEEDFVQGCPLPYGLATTWELKANDIAPMLLRPGVYEFNVAYPQPQPGVANSLFLTIGPGGKQTITIKDDGATSDDPATQILFPGRQAVAGSNLRPIIACNAVAPEGVDLRSGDPGATALPSRIVVVDGLKLEQLPPKGPGIGLTGVANDPESSDIYPYWTVTGGLSKATVAGQPVASGAEIRDQFTFQPAVAGHYTVFLTVYDDKGLFDECRWDLEVKANLPPAIKLFSGRTTVEFGRLDDERSAGVGPIVPLPAAMRPGVAAPVVVPSQATAGQSVVWDGLTLCPTTVAGPYASVPEDLNSVVGVPAPVDRLLPEAGADATNRWENPGRTCVWALVADADGDPLQTAWEFPGPIFGSGTFYAAVAVPAGFHAGVPDGMALGTFIRTNPQLEAYNAWISELANLGGVVPAIVWEAWDDPCITSGGMQNPCPSDISGGGVENIVAQTTDGFRLPPRTGYTPIAVLPEGVAEGGDCSGVMFISSLTPQPPDPAPSEDVYVTARVAPLVEGCLVDMSIAGTDTYQNQEAIATNKSGEVRFFIPGGGEDVVDVVTARFCSPVPEGTQVDPAAACQMPSSGAPGRWIEMQVTYRF